MEQELQTPSLSDDQIDHFVNRHALICAGLAWQYKWPYEKAAEFTSFSVSASLMYLKVPARVDIERIIKAAVQESLKTYYVYIVKHWTQREVPDGPQVYRFKQT